MKLGGHPGQRTDFPRERLRIALGERRMGRPAGPFSAYHPATIERLRKKPEPWNPRTIVVDGVEYEVVFDGS